MGKRSGYASNNQRDRDRHVTALSLRRPCCHRKIIWSIPGESPNLIPMKPAPFTKTALIAVLLLCLQAPCGQAAEEPLRIIVPQYRLRVGSVLFYSTYGKYEYGDTSFTETGTNTLFVVGALSNGNWRVFSVHDLRVYDKDNTEQDEQRRFSIFELGTNGEIFDSPFPPQSEAHRHSFIPLPAPDKLVTTNGILDNWSVTHPGTAEIQTYRYQSYNAENQWFFSSTLSGSLNTVHEREQIGSYRFEAKAGLLERAEIRTRGPGPGGMMRGSGIYQLTRADALMDALMAKLAHDVEAYITARRSYDACMRNAPGKHPDAIQAYLRDCAEILRSLETRVRHPLVIEAIRQDLAGHYQSRTLYLRSAEAHGSRIGQQAPAWQAADLDENHHASGDYLGRVLVLDFWYRRCFWCTKSMPQMKMLTAKYTQRGLAVLGMNVDPRVEDARYVADTMALNYPTLRGGELARTFNVTAFPTVIIIDRKGRLRHVLTGYVHRLADNLSEILEPLLDE